MERKLGSKIESSQSTLLKNTALALCLYASAYNVYLPTRRKTTFFFVVFCCVGAAGSFIPTRQLNCSQNKAAVRFHWQTQTDRFKASLQKTEVGLSIHSNRSRSHERQRNWASANGSNPSVASVALPPVSTHQ